MYLAKGFIYFHHLILKLELISSIKRSHAIYSVIKWGSLIVLVLLLAFHFEDLKHSVILWDTLNTLVRDSDSWWKISVMLIFVILNYTIEAAKWKQLLRPITVISLWLAFKGIMMGILFSVFTPGRLGEFGGRMLVLEQRHRLSGVASVLVGSLAQNLSIMVLGTISALYLYKLSSGLPVIVLASTWILILSATGIGLMVYYNISLLISVIEKWKIRPSWKKHIHSLTVLSNYSSRELSRILMISILRIAVWVATYLFIWLFIFRLSIDVNFVAAALLLFMLQTGVPLPPITGILARGGLAVFIWGHFGIDEWSALIATFILYFFNLIIPSIVGVFVLLFNYRKN